MDARRCISYLTIEHKGPVDIKLREGMGNHIYGCDDCLSVCPWNKFAVEASDIRYAANEELVAPKLADLVGLTEREFRKKFSGSPIKRIGRDRFVRNVLYAIGNSENQDYLPLISTLQLDPDPGVADAASWATERLSCALD
jgi:epoxyqueuosine reductase